LAEEPLVERNIEDGRRIVEGLDSSRFEVQSAFWFYTPASHKWTLFIVTPLVDNLGPREAYARVQTLLLTVSPRPQISLKDISLLSPQNELVRLLRLAIKTGPGISGIRFTRNTINGVFIQDAYIYRLQ
jgi:hypothetical protein